MIRRHLANGVSLSRTVLLVPWVFIAAAGGWAAPVIFALIIVTDIIDGPIARRLGTARGRGAAIDAGCDAAVVVVGALVLGTADIRYAVLALLMMITFGSWYAGIPRQPRIGVGNGNRYTHLGRYNGVWCYGTVFIGSVVISNSPFPGSPLGEVLMSVESLTFSLTGILLILSTLENLFTLRGPIGFRRHPQSPPASR